jgi:hypothetical protein
MRANVRGYDARRDSNYVHAWRVSLELATYDRADITNMRAAFYSMYSTARM